jgi:dienelactone hydrolase
MFTSPLEYNKEKLRALIPSMRWDGKEAFSAWQERGRQKLPELLGLPFEKCEDKFQVEYEEDRGTITETRFVFQSEEGFFIPCHFQTPKNVPGPMPLVICLQGHSKGMHISMGRPKYPGDEQSINGGDRDFAVRIMKEGYCALIMEQRYFGELAGHMEGKGTLCQDVKGSTQTALLIGRTVIGERVWDIQRVLDVIPGHFPQADMNKVICMGNSGGGTASLYAGCVEPRITFTMPSCAFCSIDYHIDHTTGCPCRIVPRLRLFFDQGDMAGLIAPRPLVIVAGREDPISPYLGVLKAFGDAKRMYEAAGAPDNVRLVTGEGGHRFYADAAWGTLNPFIKGIQK